MVPKLEDIKIALVGLGYVGLPLAVAFGKTQLAPVIGFNKSQNRIDILKTGHDPNAEVSNEELKEAKIEYTTDPAILKQANFIIVTVPTPINKAKQPDLSLVKDASQMIGENLQRGAVVIYESTVFPGVTEDICAPIIEESSGLKCGIDWKIGYSPERVNPGDKEHTLESIVKVVSGMDEETLELVAQVYGLICKAGVHKAPNIKTAEAAKVIENIQRDLNIALVNELALIFHRLGINTKEVLDAASTKWNFHKYQPGSPGGHCIPVDPYYLTYRAEELGYHPQVILAGRRVNDYMAEYIADLMIQGLVEAKKVVRGSRVLVLGLTFKENIKDTRNSKVKDVIKKLKDYKINILAYDPMLSREEARDFNVEYFTKLEDAPKVDGIILCVPHNEFKNLSLQSLKDLTTDRPVLVDIKGLFSEIFRNNQDIFIYRTL